MKRFALLAGLLAMALCVSGCATAIGTSPKGAELPIEKAAMKFTSDIKEGRYGIVGTDDLNKLIAEKKDFILIDTMPAANYAAGHIKGAVNGPIAKAEAEVTQAEIDGLLKVAGQDKDKQIVTYCGFVACRRSHIAAKTLKDNGFKNVLRYPAGIVGWKEAGYPME